MTGRNLLGDGSIVLLCDGSKSFGGQRHILGAVKKSKLCGTAPDYKGKMCGKVR